MIPSVQAEADRIVAKALTVVCTGWTEPRHETLVLKHGDPARVSHGLCPTCDAEMRKSA